MLRLKTIIYLWVIKIKYEIEVEINIYSKIVNNSFIEDETNDSFTVKQIGRNSMTYFEKRIEKFFKFF